MKSIIIETPHNIGEFIQYLNSTSLTPLTKEDKSDIVDIIFRVVNGIAFNHTTNVVFDILTEVLNLNNFTGYDIDVHGSVLSLQIDNATTELFTMLNEMDLIGKTINVVDYQNTNIRLNIY